MKPALLLLCASLLALTSCTELRYQYQMRAQPEGMSMEEFMHRYNRGEFPELRKGAW